MGKMRRKLMLGLVAVAGVAPAVGCGVPINRYDSDPNYRMTQLLNESEDLRQAREEVHRFWMNNQPSVLTYERLNGAIGP